MSTNDAIRVCETAGKREVKELDQLKERGLKAGQDLPRG
jgi:hypothetical protein